MGHLIQLLLLRSECSWHWKLGHTDGATAETLLPTVIHGFTGPCPNISLPLADCLSFGLILQLLSGEMCLQKLPVGAVAPFLVDRLWQGHFCGSKVISCVCHSMGARSPLLSSGTHRVTEHIPLPVGLVWVGHPEGIS